MKDYFSYDLNVCVWVCCLNVIDVSTFCGIHPSDEDDDDESQRWNFCFWCLTIMTKWCSLSLYPHHSYFLHRIYRLMRRRSCFLVAHFYGPSTTFIHRTLSSDERTYKPTNVHHCNGYLWCDYILFLLLTKNFKRSVFVAFVDVLFIVFFLFWDTGNIGQHLISARKYFCFVCHHYQMMMNQNQKTETMDRWFKFSQIKKIFSHNSSTNGQIEYNDISQAMEWVFQCRNK